jgi:hypothetical protein
MTSGVAGLEAGVAGDNAVGGARNEGLSEIQRSDTKALEAVPDRFKPHLPIGVHHCLSPSYPRQNSYRRSLSGVWIDKGI